MLDENDGYRTTKGNCQPGGIEREYKTLDEAMESCTKIEECQAVYDLACDFIGPFTVCNGIENVVDNESNGCLHMKNSSKTKHTFPYVSTKS